MLMIDTFLMINNLDCRQTVKTSCKMFRMTIVANHLASKCRMVAKV